MWKIKQSSARWRSYCSWSQLTTSFSSVRGEWAWIRRQTCGSEVTLWMEVNSQCAGTWTNQILRKKSYHSEGYHGTAQCIMVLRMESWCSSCAEEMSKDKGLMQHQTIWTESWLIKSWKSSDRKFCLDRSSLLSAQKKKREGEILVMNMLNLTVI